MAKKQLMQSSPNLPWIQPDARGRIQLPKSLRKYPLFQLKEESGSVQLIPFEAKPIELKRGEEEFKSQGTQSQLWRQPQVRQFFNSKLKPKLTSLFHSLCGSHPHFKSQRVAVVHYGSRMRGDALNTSDFDIAVFSEKFPSFSLRSEVNNQFEETCADELRELKAHHVSTDFNFIFLTSKWESKRVPPIYFTILSEGEVLFDPSGMIKELQSKFKALKRESKLTQEGLGKSKKWKWKNA